MLIINIVLIILFIPIISKVCIHTIHWLPIQKLLFNLGNMALILHPPCCYNLRVNIDNVIFEGNTSNALMRRLYLDPRYKRPLIKFMYSYSSNFNIFIDIGAKEGYFSLLMARLCKRVISVERSKKIIKNNISINNMKNVSICTSLKKMYERLESVDRNYIKIIKIDKRYISTFLITSLMKYATCNNVIWIVETPRDGDILNLLRNSGNNYQYLCHNHIFY